MIFDFVALRRWTPFLIAFTLVILGAGCEDNGQPLEQIIAERATSDTNTDGSPNPTSFDFGNNDTNAYVCLGDSITEECGYPGKLDAMLPPEAQVYNEGMGGEESAGGLSRVSGVLSRYHPGHLLILYGANDLMHGEYRNVTVENLRSIARIALAANTRPIVATLTPQPGYNESRALNIQRLNWQIIEMATEENIPYVDLGAEFEGAGLELFPDGVHPNSSGARIIATAFYEVLQGLY